MSLDSFLFSSVLIFLSYAPALTIAGKIQKTKENIKGFLANRLGSECDKEGEREGG